MAGGSPFDDRPEPEPGPGEALVAVEAVGICGSDLHAWHGHDLNQGLTVAAKIVLRL